MDKYFFSNTGTYLNPPHPVSDELIERLERERGFVLPPSYIELLKIQNGGYIRKNLFLFDVDQEQHIESLAGIGEDRNGGRDLLVPVNHPVFVGEDVSLILPFDYCNYGYTALDYRTCGPNGTPGIISLSVLEPPLIISKVADNFDVLLKGLQRGENQYIFAFAVNPEDLSDLVSRLQKNLKARVSVPDPGDMPSYRFWVQSEEKEEFFYMEPNINYATHYDGEKVLSRPAGLEFPEFPEFNWLFYFYPDMANINEVVEKIVASGVALDLLHEPQPDLEAWVVPPKKK